MEKKSSASTQSLNLVAVSRIIHNKACAEYFILVGEFLFSLEFDEKNYHRLNTFN